MKKLKIILFFLMCLNTAHSHWEECTVIHGYPVTTMALMESDLYTGTFGGGVYLSTDNGESWLEINNGLTMQDIRDLTVIGNYLYVGTRGGGVFLSTDKGESWTAVNNGMASIYVEAVVASGSNILAGTFDGVFLSTDNGTNWTALNNGLTNLHVNALAVSENNFYAGTWEGGIFFSSDNGANWTALNEGLTIKYVLSLAVIGNNILAGTQNGLFLSTDNGLSWEAVNNEVTGLPHYRIEALLVNENIVYAGIYGKGVYLSTDNGLNWSQINNGLPENPLVLSLAISGDNIYTGTGLFGVFRAHLSDFGITKISYDNKLNSDISISPNPASDYIEITLSNHPLKGMVEKVRVYDVLGVCVMTASIHPMTQSHQMNIESLPSGVYFVRVGGIMEKFVKL